MEGGGGTALMAIVAGRRDMPLSGVKSAEEKQEKGKEHRMAQASDRGYRISLWERMENAAREKPEHRPNLRTLKSHSSQLPRGT
jgi:hypothetical protein